MGQLEDLAKKVGDEYRSLERLQRFVEQVREAWAMDPPNFSVLRRALESEAQDDLVKRFPEFAEAAAAIKEATSEAWKQMQLTAGGDFLDMAQAEGLEAHGRPPKIRVGRGIDVEFRVKDNRTIVNGVMLKTVDARDVMKKVKEEHERIWGGDFDAEGFLDRLYSAFQSEAGEKGNLEDGVPILGVFEKVKENLPAKQRKGYTKEVFSAQITRLLESGASTPDGRTPTLLPTATRAEAIWLFLPDRDDWAYRGRILFREVS